jgi:hypothetical protein
VAVLVAEGVFKDGSFARGRCARVFLAEAEKEEEE